MAKLTVKEIQDRALAELAAASATGIRYMELAKKIHSAAPETPFNTVHGALHGVSLSQEIVRPSRGLWVLKKFWEKDAGAATKPELVSENNSLAEKIQKLNEES